MDSKGKEFVRSSNGKLRKSRRENITREDSTSTNQNTTTGTVPNNKIRRTPSSTDNEENMERAEKKSRTVQFHDDKTEETEKEQDRTENPTPEINNRREVLSFSVRKNCTVFVAPGFRLINSKPFKFRTA